MIRLVILLSTISTPPEHQYITDVPRQVRFIFVALMIPSHRFYRLNFHSVCFGKSCLFHLTTSKSRNKSVETGTTETYCLIVNEYTYGKALCSRLCHPVNFWRRTCRYRNPLDPRTGWSASCVLYRRCQATLAHTCHLLTAMNFHFEDSG
jgi:hypothetical protein